MANQTTTSAVTSSVTDETKTFHVAYIGAGAIIQRGHIPAFSRVAGVENVAICDINPARAQEVADEAGIEAVFTDYQEMLAQIQPDIVVIATPNVFHVPMTLAALDAGANVLCEKPLALTLEDAKEVFARAEAVDRLLTVGTHYRWSTPTRACKAHVDGGFFGEIYAARTVWQRRNGIPGYGSWFTNKDLAGGGSLLDIGVHALDRALFLMDYPHPVTVSGASYAKFGTRGLGLGGWGSDILQPTANARYDVDDFTWAFVRFDNGTVMQFQVSWAAHFEEQFYTELYGTEGGGYVANRADMELYTTLNKQPVTIKTEAPIDPVGSYPRMIESMLRYLGGDKDAEIVTPHQALTSVRIVDGIMRSAKTGKEVEITG
jgi:predicted dehydrogenase